MDMVAQRKEFTTLTERYQTTVPKGVREVLKLQKHDKLCYTLEGNGRVYLEAARDEEDPALGAFLNFLEADVTANPQRLAAFDGALHERLRALVGDVEVDLDAELSPDEE